jgi:hypothetical protein
MAQGEHVHDWHYSDSRIVITSNCQKRIASRYCKNEYCAVYEEYELKDVTI